LTTSGALSPRLHSLLSAAPRDEDSAIAEIAANPLMVEQVQGHLERLKREASEPAGEEGIRRVILAYTEVYPQPERSQGQWAMFWAPYVESLADVPLPALEMGMRVWAAMPDSEFLPKPGKLRELARTVANPAVTAYYIAMKAIRAAEERALIDARPQLARHEILALPQIAARAIPSEASRQSVRNMAAQFAEHVQASKPERAALPPNPVTFAPGLHITATMVDHLRRQNPDFDARDKGGPTIWPAEEGEIDPEAFS
jgi:hypothetical protein